MVITLLLILFANGRFTHLLALPKT
jgi:hypothetical protein